MPRVRALQHRDDIVQAAHGEADDEQDQRDEHQDDAPVLAAGRAGQDGLRRVERPAGAGRPAGREEARHQHQHGEQVDPVAQHVDIGKHHVARADHQRDQVVAEAAEEQRGQQVDHHDHAVHGDELVVGFGVMKAKVPGKPSCRRISQDSTSATRPMAIAVPRILDGDDLGVLREDVLRPPALRMVELDFRDFGGRDCHLHQA